MKFGDLKAKMRDWLAVPTGRISDTVCGDLLNLSMRELLRFHDLRFGEATVPFDTVASQPDYDLPAGWSRPHTLWYLHPDTGGIVFLNQRMKERFDLDHPKTSVTGDPAAYNVWGATMRLGPTPSRVVTVSQNFYRILPDLVDDNDENEFTLHAWEPIFFRALTEATKYLIEDPRTSLWEQKAIATENRLVLEHSRATHAGGRLVIEEPG